MIKYEFEDNWARNVLDLHVRYSLPLNDKNVRLLSKGVWKSMVKKQVKTYAFSLYEEGCSKSDRPKIIFIHFILISF